MTEYNELSDNISNNETIQKPKFSKKLKLMLSSINKLIIYSGIFLFGLILAIVSYSLDALDYKILSTFNAFDIGQIAQISNLLLGILLIPIFSNLSDILGRGIILAICLVFIISGSLIVGFSSTFSVYSTGYVIAGVGETVRGLIIPVILADLLSAKNKSLGFILYWAPNALALGISIPIVNLVQFGDHWKYLYLSQVALVIFTGAPILLGLFRIQFNDRGGYKKLSKLSALKAVDWTGILLLTLGLGFILAPFTLVIRMDNGFSSPAIFIPIIIGSLMLVVFFVWEIKFSKTPLITSKLLNNRVCLSIILIRAFLQFDQTLTWQYMNAYLALSRGISAYDVNLINLGYKVPWFVFGFACALVIRKVSDIRSIIWISVGIYAIGVGLTIPSRSPDTYVGVVSFIEGVIGSGSGIAACATLVVLQTSVDPSEVANVSAIDTLLTNALSSIASGIAAIVWTKSLAQNLAQKLPVEYKTQIPELIADTNKLAKLPTSIRELWINALSDSQWLICTVAISFACVCFVIALSLPPIGFQRVEDEGDEIIFDNETKEKLLANE